MRPCELLSVFAGATVWPLRARANRSRPLRTSGFLCGRPFRNAGGNKAATAGVVSIGMPLVATILNIGSTQ
jgi:hypothetical protein